jgi:NADPH:quinone reductase-like Zn-dependent oxidoreductase
LFNPLYFALPIPSSFPSKDVPKDADTAILVYGAGSTTGQYAVQLLSLAGYRKIIATASGQHHEYLHSLGATATFDYKDPLMKDKIADYLGGDGKVHLAIDCVTSTGTLKIIAGLVRDTSQVALLLPIKEGSNVRALDDSSTMHMTMPGSNPLPNGTKHHGVRTFLYQEVSIHFGGI